MNRRTFRGAEAQVISVRHGLKSRESQAILEKQPNRFKSHVANERFEMHVFISVIGS